MPLDNQKALASASLKCLFYIICLALALFCFYFSISGNIFAWIYPDEEIASNVLGISHAVTHFSSMSFLTCALQYYYSTTINRPTADLGLCVFAQAVKFFSTPYMGWIFIRFLSYLTIAFALAAPMKSLCRIPYKLSIIFSFILLSIALFVISDYTYIFSAGFAIYATATVTFYLLIATFSKSIKSDKWFFLFCLLFGLNIASHELFLVISGFFIPLYAFFKYKDGLGGSDTVNYKAAIIYLLKEKRIWLLCFIYVFFALVMIFAPGISIREKVWPSTGSTLDALIYVLQTYEEVFFFLVRSWFLILILFVLGCVAAIRVNYKKTEINSCLCVLLFCAPLLYLSVAAYLFGLAPSLWGLSFRPPEFDFLHSILLKFIENPTLLKRSEFSVMSRNLFIYVSIFFNFLLAGFLLTRAWMSKRNIKNSINDRRLYLYLLFIGLIMVGFNPDGVGSLKIIPAFLGDVSVPSSLLSYSKYQLSNPESSIAQYMMPLSKVVAYVGGAIFKRSFSVNHAMSREYIGINHYFEENRDGFVSADVEPLLYSEKPMAPDYPEPMKSQLYEMYHIKIRQKCLLSTLSSKEGFCYNTQGNKQLALQLLQNRHFSTSAINVNFDLKTASDISYQKVNNCLVLTDKPERGLLQHSIESKPIHLDRGYYDFVLSTSNIKTQLFLFLTNKNISINLPWYSVWNAPPGLPLDFIFSQVREIKNKRILYLIIKSKKTQNITLRWQHGYDLNPFYRVGSHPQTSSICAATYQFIKTV